MPKIMIFLACALVAGLVLFSGSSVFGQGGRMFIQLQEKHFSIPESRIEMSYPFWLDSLFRGERESISVKFSVTEILESFEVDLPEEVSKKYIYVNIPRNFLDQGSSSVPYKAWMGIPPYSGEYGALEEGGFYAIQYDDSSSVWAILSKPIDHAEEVPPVSQFWIGICTSPNSIILDNSTTCSTISDERSLVRYTFRITGDLIPYMGYFRSYINNRMEIWAGERDGDI